MPQRITLRNANDLTAFVEHYQPSKEAFARIIHQRFGLIAFPSNFDDVPAMLDAWRHAMRCNPRPIYMGVNYRCLYRKGSPHVALTCMLLQWHGVGAMHCIVSWSIHL
jgi:hypothetical protein